MEDVPEETLGHFSILKINLLSDSVLDVRSNLERREMKPTTFREQTFMNVFCMLSGNDDKGKNMYSKFNVVLSTRKS